MSSERPPKRRRSRRGADRRLTQQASRPAKPRKKMRRREQNLEKATKEDLVKVLMNVEEAFKGFEDCEGKAARSMHNRGLCDYVNLYYCEEHFVPCDACGIIGLEPFDGGTPVAGKDNAWACSRCVDQTRKAATRTRGQSH